MIYPEIKANVPRRQTQELKMLGINLTDQYTDGQLESCRNISTRRYPYITTAEQRQLIDTGVPTGYQPISIFAWEKLFVVSDEPSTDGGYKCYYGGQYCGDVQSLDGPKQYAVVNSKLVVWPDKVYFDLYDISTESHLVSTAKQLVSVYSGQVICRKAAE